MNDEERFPLITFLIATIYLAVFLFTYKNISSYQNQFGFVPAKIEVLDLFTYSFIHADLFHLITNLALLVVIGLALEDAIGKFYFSFIYFASSMTAILFDILGRFILNISFNAPFIGGSGAIFGLLAIAVLFKPTEKIPIFFLLVAFLPFIQLIFESGILSNQLVLMWVLLLSTIAILFVFLKAFQLPLHIVLVIYLLSWLISLALKYPLSVSFIGHLGGVVGGILGFILIAEKKKQTFY